MKHLFQALPLALLAAASQPLVGQAIWSHAFKVADTSLPAFEGGILSPLRVPGFESGYSLNGFSSRPNRADPDSPIDVKYLSRFNATGQNLWNVSFDPDGSATDLDLVPLITASDLLFATYNEAQGFTTKGFRLGLLCSSDNSVVFAKRFETTLDEPHAVEFFDDARIGATIDRGQTLDSIVFDQTGATTFHKRYSSANFVAPDIFVTQFFDRDFLPGGNGYRTTVSKRSLIPSVVTLTSFVTDLAGEVTASNSFQFVPELFGSFPFVTNLADGGTLYRFIGNFNGITIGGSAVPVTHLIQINADGSLAWSKTIYGSLLIGAFPTADALYLTGSRPTPDASSPGQTDALVIRLDLNTGDLLNQAAFTSIADLDFVQGVIVDAEHIFVTIFSRGLGFDPETPPTAPTSTLVKMDLDFTNLEGKRYLGDEVSLLTADDSGQTIDRFIFSPSQNEAFEIRAFTLDGNLDPIADCDLFTSVTPTLSADVIALADLAVTVAPATVTATDLNTAIENSTMAFTSYSLATTDFCSLSKGLKITLGASGDELNFTFPTEAETTYHLLFSADLSQPFTEVESLVGTGSPGSFTRPLGGGKGFYRLSPPPAGEE